MLRYSRNRVKSKKAQPSGNLVEWVLQHAWRDQGSALVEMALVSSLLLAMLFGIFQVSIALYAYNYVNDAAREGARWAIVRGSQCSTNTPNLDHCGASSADIQTYVRSLGFPYSGSLTASATWCTATTTSGVTTWSAQPCSGTKDPGNMVSVAVSLSYPLNIPFIKQIPLTLSSTSNMVVSQ
ncbi:pilus assembly protein [Telmatobacter sp. DSM 110680]|uniref:Pilus assembly protein n=1 Tax=Telmatobacter sp. DSM 110680 TaxID=3036704 RepID=A0AAU7DLC2_9BACT